MEKNIFLFSLLGYYENYNEMEKYYIQERRTLAPDGYNMALGGEEPPVLKGENNPASVITESIANEIKQDLLNKNIRRRTIKEKYKITEDILRHINRGDSWRDERLTYPLRGFEADIVEEKVEEVKRLLKETKMTQKEIGNLFGFSRSFVTMINIGENHYDPLENYPIRKQNVKRLTPVEEIKQEILNSKTPLNQIAEKFQVSTDVVYNINQGRTYRDQRYTYPLRNN